MIPLRKTYEDTWIHLRRDWQDPVATATSVPDSEKSWVLFYSGMELSYTGVRSILALRKTHEISGSDFSGIEPLLSANQEAFENAWFGYLGYGLKNCLEKFPADQKGFIETPDLWLAQYGLILVFDHKNKVLDVWARTEADLAHIPSPSPAATQPIEVQALYSNMNKAEYLQKVEDIKEAILRGDLYQANLTRKFFGTFAAAPKPFKIFEMLKNYSPAPYSAFLRLGDTCIISSSPERFLHIDREGNVETRPIKGSEKRSVNPEEDRNLKTKLQNSEKDRAENLMIVDLMRNDLSRSCVPGSVEVESLYDVTSYATIHHMSSTIKGKKSHEKTTLDLVKGCFPPGSMTGAPKIKAIELCSQLECEERGVYSGAIGWFGGDGSADLSVVIRTLIVQGNKFEFQVGGAIVSDSVPEEEWRETLTKAKGMVTVLGISDEEIESL